jgi:glycosyltransferase involved in cell wall biosynthesis
MKLLVITQKVDEKDPILGFFHSWINEFSKNCELVNVICLEEGEHHLPTNVHIFSLGKEKGKGRVSYVLNFYQYIWRLRNSYDTVFVHMNPEYIVLGGLLWRSWHKKIILWYVHRQVNLKLRIASSLSNLIFTSAKESFGLKSSKIEYVGHGIEIDKFKSIPEPIYNPLVLTHVGRIAPIKNLEVMIKALQFLVEAGVDAQLKFVGEAGEKDEDYKKKMSKLAENLDIASKVVWAGIEDNVRAYSEASLTINAAPDGGMDKSVLESWAAGRASFASNRAFKDLFGEYSNLFMYPYDDAEALATSIKNFLISKDSAEVRAVSERVRREFGIEKLIKTLVGKMHV